MTNEWFYVNIESICVLMYSFIRRKVYEFECEYSINAYDKSIKMKRSAYIHFNNNYAVYILGLYKKCYYSFENAVTKNINHIPTIFNRKHN